MRSFYNYRFKQEIVDIDGNNVVQYIYTLGAAEERRSATEPDRSAEYENYSLFRLTFETFFSKNFYCRFFYTGYMLL